MGERASDNNETKSGSDEAANGIDRWSARPRRPERIECALRRCLIERERLEKETFTAIDTETGLIATHACVHKTDEGMGDLVSHRQ